MPTQIELTERAFAFLESLAEPIAFELFRRIDRLSVFPDLGSPLETRFRQLVYKRRIRVIYEYDIEENCVYILAIQNCRQKLPRPRDLKRDPDIEG
jgi:mRNA-degrading endonuclease RelE of RelBE toxin-antitoxin system